MTDHARLSAAIKNTFIMLRHDLHIHSDADLMAIADHLATDLINSLGVYLPSRKPRIAGRRAPVHCDVKLPI